MSSVRDTRPITLYDNRFSCHLDSKLYNGPMDPTQSRILGMSKAGCPYRGTVTCYQCSFEPVMECDYNCGPCAERHRCRCGHDQTLLLETRGLV
jgi:hypothetical protein